MRIKSLHVENFKKFEKLELTFTPFNLLVGPNNSGKSTVLQACALFDYCYRNCLERRNGELGFHNPTLGPEEFAIIPSAHPLDLWTSRRPGSSKGLIPIRLQCEFDSGKRLGFEIRLNFNRFSIQSDSDNVPPTSDEPFVITLIPGFTGFWPREEKRTPAVQRDMRTQGQHGGIIRNILWNLKSNSAKWEEFRSLMAQVFPAIHLHDPAFEEAVDRYIRVGYDEEEVVAAARRRRPVEFDLFSAGSGFHQFLQITAGILIDDATTVLLDEPDAHLFGKLQSELYQILTTLASKGRQIIAATHSTELIAAADPRQIVSFANGAPSRLNVQPEVLHTVAGLGSLENLGLVLIDAHRRVIVVEDESDERLLRRWLEKVLAENWAGVQRSLVFLHAHRRPSGDYVNVMLNAIQQAFRTKADLQVQAVVVADRDYRPDSAVLEELKKYRGPAFARQRWHIWQRSEIENYHLSPEPIWRAIERQREADTLPLLDLTYQTFLHEVERIVESQRGSVKGRIMDALHDTDRKLQPSTLDQMTEQVLAKEWRGDRRFELCDAKDVVWPQLRDFVRERLGMNLGDPEILREFQTTEVPAEIVEFCGRIREFMHTNPRRSE
jgi:predicted ATPase